MTEPCPTCDFIGPDRLATTSAARDLHRAFHEASVRIALAFEPFVTAVREASDRERQATQDAFVLISEGVAASLRGEK